jgi:hypothetical protein
VDVTEARRNDAVARRRPVLRDVIEEHLEQIGFLSIQRRKMLFSPEAGLPSLLELDDRIAAHHEGLRIAGPVGVEVAEGRLGDPDPWQHYVAARIWLEEGRPSSDRVLARLVAATEDDLPSWREALRRLSGHLLLSLLPIDSRPLPPPVLPLAADAWGWHGQLPAELARSLTASPLGAVRAAIARAIARDNRLEAGLLDLLIEDQDPEVARRALWSGVLRAPDTATDLCRKFLARHPGDPFVVQALGFVGELKDMDRGAESMESLWRLAVGGAEVGLPGLRFEVPDGFFAAAQTLEALVGE